MKLCAGRHSRWLFDSFELSGLYRPTDKISPEYFLGGDFSTPDTLMQHSHRPETPEIADENPASVNGEKFETYQARGALLDDGCW